MQYCIVYDGERKRRRCFVALSGDAVYHNKNFLPNGFLSERFMKNALITGATGFLGGALAQRLYQDGWLVTGLGRNREAGERLQRQGLRFVQADLRDGEAIKLACQAQDVVFHCAAAVGAWGNKRQFYEINVGGTEHVVTGCKAHGVQRLIHVSTPSIYFSTHDRFNVKEDDRLPPPVNIYAASKLRAEAVIDRAHRDGVAVVTIRPRAIFGPGDTTIFPRLLKVIQSGKLPILGDGKNVQDLTYIDNVVDALLLCVDAPNYALGRKYNISNGEAVRLWEVLGRLCREFGYLVPTRQMPVALPMALATLLEVGYTLLRIEREPAITRYSVSLLARSMTLDISAAKCDLGYVPRVKVEEGLERFIGWWRDQGSVVAKS